MELKKLKHRTNGFRHVVKTQKNLISKSNRLVKSILFKNIKRSVRSPSNGRISSWHKSGGVKNIENILTKNSYFKEEVNWLKSKSKSVKKNFFYTADHNFWIGLLHSNMGAVELTKLKYMSLAEKYKNEGISTNPNIEQPEIVFFKNHVSEFCDQRITGPLDQHFYSMLARRPNVDVTEIGLSSDLRTELSKQITASMLKVFEYKDYVKICANRRFDTNIVHDLPRTSWQLDLQFEIVDFFCHVGHDITWAIDRLLNFAQANGHIFQMFAIVITILPVICCFAPTYYSTLMAVQKIYLADGASIKIFTSTMGGFISTFIFNIKYAIDVLEGRRHFLRSMHEI